MRRAYPRPSAVTQPDVVGLLTVGSASEPGATPLLAGAAGASQLVAVRQEGEEKGLAALFEREKEAGGRVLGQGGMPPFPPSQRRRARDGWKFELEREQSYGNQ